MSTGKSANCMTTCHKVIYDRKYIDAVLEETEEQKVFVIGSKTLDTTSEIISNLTSKLESLNKLAGKFTGIEAHTTDTSCIKAANEIRESGASHIVTIGGGSITDAAKAIRMCITYGIQDSAGFQKCLVSCFLGSNFTGQLFTPLPIDFSSDLCVINIPTTLSTGAFSLIAGVKHTQKGHEYRYLHDKLVANVVILDPSVTVHTPDWLWLSSGVRAIDHCIETICSPMTNILADTACHKGLKLLLGSLKNSVRTSSAGLQDRRNCMLGAWLSVTGLTQDVMLGASHGIGNILGAYGVSNGYSSCIMAPHIIKYNWVEMTEEMKNYLIDAFNGDRKPHLALFEYIKELNILPQSLNAVGIPANEIPHIAKKSMLDAFTISNLRPISASDIELILNGLHLEPERAINL